MAAPTRLALRLRQAWTVSPARTRTFTTTKPTAAGEQWPQRTPLGSYYESIINRPSPRAVEEKPGEPSKPADQEDQLPAKKPADAPAPAPTKKKPGRKPKSEASAASPAASMPSPPMPSPPPASAAEKARIVFGSRLLGPAEQADYLAAKLAHSTTIAGVVIPPRPDEPDNCCMSGCVNCVWDRYREEMEDWSAKKREAQVRLSEGAGTMDADGGGSSAGMGAQLGDAKIAKDLWDDEVFQNLPVGIREFMKQEKRLKEMHEREGTEGG